VFLNASGFDPSLFHDDDGRKWLVNMVWDHRKDKNKFGGILLQEYSAEQKRLTGPVRNIFRGVLGATEGPHMYKINGYYYLMTAEGGTGYNHAATVARSKKIEGPYEVDPENPMLTSKNNPALELQKAGHASLVHTQSDEWYLVHLCSRPVGQHRRSILGRETAIQKCRWTSEGWLRIEGGENVPQVSVPAPNLPSHSFEREPDRDDFNTDKLSVHFSTLRNLPDSSWLSLTERPGYLRLYGRQSPCSRHEQSLIARRVQSLNTAVRTCVEFEPQSFQQMAGLICFYNVENWMYLRISHDETAGKSLNIIVCDNNVYDEILQSDIGLALNTPVHLGVKWRTETLQFEYSANGSQWKDIGPALDATKISDDYARGAAFTGAFAGLCCQDLTGQKRAADFDYFSFSDSSRSILS
jgi:xylan 1,4-beta-xylosidase